MGFIATATTRPIAVVAVDSRVTGMIECGHDDLRRS